MASTWRVLAPMDLRFDTEAPVQYAAAVAGALDAELVLLHVTTTRSRQRPYQLSWPRSAWGTQTPRVDIHRLMLPGPVAETIVGYADYLDADMLLMTTRTYGERRRLWRRSVTREVMETSQRPVCVARMLDAEGPFHYGRVLCLVGLQGQDARVVAQAQEVAHKTNAELTLLYIVPESSEGLLAYGVDGPQGRPLSEKLARDKLIELAARLYVPFTTSVMTGSPAKCIGIAAREHAASLVVAPRLVRPACFESRGAFTADLESALSRLDCPLLTVPLGGGSETTRMACEDVRNSSVQFGNAAIR